MSSVGCFEYRPVGAGIESDVPSAFVDEVMMKPAQQNKVFEFGFAVERPVNDVMRLTDAGVGATAGEGAAAVA